jgi:pyrroline-5-carboxylate reductase
LVLAGETGIEPATDGFGDRYSTNCATPLRTVEVYRVGLRCVNINAIFSLSRLATALHFKTFGQQEETMSIAFIGIGNMGSALARGYLAVHSGSAPSLFVYDANDATAAAFCNDTGCTRCHSAAEAVDGVRMVVLAVKPQILPEVLVALRPNLTAETLLVSIAAGVSLQKLRDLAGSAPVVARAMPNTPALVGSGATAISFDGAAEADISEVLSFFESVGIALRVEEKLMDAVTGLSGSGPAYVMLFIEALSDAGVRLGLARDVALRLAAAMVKGSAAMVLETGTHPAVLKDQVCSPGGTTIEGIRVLEKSGFRSATIEAVSASARRSAELSGRTGPEA